MLSYIQAIILGALQGITELFPISSLGHSVIFPQLFGWHIHQQDEFFLVFLVATHFATALVLLGFFWRDWLRIFKGIIRSFRAREIKETDTDKLTQISCKYKDGRTVWINVALVSAKVSRIEVRVGVWGGQKEAHAILDGILAHL